MESRCRLLCALWTACAGVAVTHRVRLMRVRCVYGARCCVGAVSVVSGCRWPVMKVGGKDKGKDTAVCWPGVGGACIY